MLTKEKECPDRSFTCCPQTTISFSRGRWMTYRLCNTYPSAKLRLVPLPLGKGGRRRGACQEVGRLEYRFALLRRLNSALRSSGIFAHAERVRFCFAKIPEIAQLPKGKSCAFGFALQNTARRRRAATGRRPYEEILGDNVEETLRLPRRDGKPVPYKTQ